MLGFGADLLWADMNRLLAFLFHQGVLDEQFLQLQQLQDHTSPNFFIGSSSSIGAKRVTSVCIAFRAASEQDNRAGCLRALEMLEHEYCYLKNKLHELFQIEQQRALAAGVRYPMQHQ
ncbi:hypothetical protein TSUD_113840 [Trifolium subterraneum]|uniref:Histidine-containing phosphotransfer protein n=1 Tax=Trifolium subterraneum TaxID=3900 RepID=A0A2Z6MVQ5_TRISU|nr:hypothetical protein TSUD_113840 [Trifolium subterraneum]